MAVAERGSFLWFMMAVTQIWLSLKLMEQVDGAITTLFGTGAAACFILALVVFRHCLLYTSPSPRDLAQSRMPASA